MGLLFIFFFFSRGGAAPHLPAGAGTFAPRSGSVQSWHISNFSVNENESFDLLNDVGHGGGIIAEDDHLHIQLVQQLFRFGPKIA